jgi:hypothetical protein
LEEAGKALQGPDLASYREAVSKALVQLEASQHREFKILFLSLLHNKWVIGLLGIFGTGVFLCIVWGSLYIFNPTALLVVNAAFTPKEGFKIWDKEFKGPLNYILLIRAFCYSTRVLDKWVQKYKESVKQAFQQQSTGSLTRATHINPVILDGKRIENLTSRDLRPTFQKERVCLLIVGKDERIRSNLLLHIVDWAMAPNKPDRVCNHIMIPVAVMDRDMDLDATVGKALVQAIGGRLQAATGKLFDEDLIEQLLRAKRILVVIDGLSRMNAEARRKLRPERLDFPINALIVTSDREEELGKVPKTKLELAV